MFRQLVLKHVLDVGRSSSQPLRSKQRIKRDVEAINLVQYDHVERRCCCSFVDIATHVEPIVTRSALHDAPNGECVPVVNKNHGNASREVTLKGDVVHPMWMYVGAHQGADIDDIDKSHLDIRKVLTQQPHCRDRLGRRHITCAGKHYIRFSGVIITGEFPNTNPTRTVVARLTHAQPLELWLFATADHIDEIPRPQAIIHDVQQAVAVRRKIDPDDLAFLHKGVVHE